MMEKIKSWMIFVGYGVVYSLLWFILGEKWLSLLMLWLGLGLGWILVDLERLVYVWQAPDEPVGRWFWQKMKTRVVIPAFLGLFKAEDFVRRSAAKNMFFWLGWVVVAVFAMTSTGGVGAKALAMGVGLRLTWDFWRDYQAGKVGEWFWITENLLGGRVRLDQKLAKNVMSLVGVVFIGLSLLFV